MPKKLVPKKNVKRVLDDVTPPNGVALRTPPKAESSGYFDLVSVHKLSIETPPLPKRPVKKFALIFFCILLVGAVGYGIYLYFFQVRAAVSLKKISGHLSASANSLLVLDSETAAKELVEAHATFEQVKGESKKLGILEIGKAIGSFWQPVKEALLVLPNFEDMLASSIEISEHITFFKREGLKLFLKGEGGPILARLNVLSEDLNTLDATSAGLLDASRSLGSLFGTPNTQDYLSLKVKLYETREFVDALSGLLKRKGNVYVALFFENPSEMRPGGGFIGSYGVLTIQNGGLKHFEVRDIYDPDGQLKLKTVPPKPLQAITTNWGARDANWFFDFPTSAEKVIYFLENSLIYKEQGVLFDAAIALNANVVASLLEVTGPIPLSKYKTELTEKNFLDEIQTEVRSGAGRAKGEPKQILKDAAPILFEKLASLTEGQMLDVVSRLELHSEKRNIRAYFKNKTLQDFAVRSNISGSMFKLPEKFSGDYLAVVNANIAGGKTDIVVEQHVKLSSRITSEGKTVNTLEISRAHKGDKERYSWYREVNQNYVRVYAPKDTELIELKGATIKKVFAPINYEKAGYETDGVVVKAEESGEEFGRAVFGSWFNVSPGTKKTLTLFYENKSRLKLEDGTMYQFVFERQPGVIGGLEYELVAPPGFSWQESGTPLFRYKSEDPDGRIILTLTLRST